MSEFAIVAVVAYIGIALAWFIFAALLWDDSISRHAKAHHARLALMAPVWPLVALAHLARMVACMALDATERQP